MRSAARFASLLLVLAWSGGFAWQALDRWTWARWCAMSCPPFTSVEFIDATRRAQDWQTPLSLAALPLAALAAWWLARRLLVSRGQSPV